MHLVILIKKISAHTGCDIIGNQKVDVDITSMVHQGRVDIDKGDIDTDTDSGDGSQRNLLMPNRRKKEARLCVEGGVA